MNYIDFFKAEGIYAAASFASGNSFFFNHVEETEILIKNFDRYLSGMIDIIDIKCFPAGWIVTFRTKTEKLIKESYKEIRSYSKVADAKHALEDVEHIISEHFRMMNSQTVRQCNKLVGRHGARVHSRFQKMLFESINDYKRFREKLKNMKIFSNQYLMEFLPEFGRVVARIGMHIDDLNTAKTENEIVKRNYEELGKRYQKLGRMLGKHVNKLKAIFHRCFVRIKLDVLHVQIGQTLSHQKHQFPPRFPIFNLI